MPDFNTSSINGKVIGERLAKMLQKLQDEALDYIWSGRRAYAVSILKAFNMPILRNSR